MRIQGREKTGFYPTPPEIASTLARYLDPPERAWFAMLDPTAGEGEALARLAEPFSHVETYGIELVRRRARVARRRLRRVYTGDARTYTARGFGVLLLNPPYDWGGDRRRLEEVSLERFVEALVPGGVLIYIIPEAQLSWVPPLLTAYFEEIRVWRFPRPYYERFGQVVVLAKRRPYPTAPSDKALEVLGELPSEPPVRYPIPPSEEAWVEQDPLIEATLIEEARASGLMEAFFSRLNEGVELGAFRPLMPLRDGHLALLLAGGYLNSTLLRGPEGTMVLKGRVEKSVIVEEQEDKRIERELSGRALALISAAINWLWMGTTPFASLLRELKLSDILSHTLQGRVFQDSALKVRLGEGLEHVDVLRGKTQLRLWAHGRVEVSPKDAVVDGLLEEGYQLLVRGLEDWIEKREQSPAFRTLAAHRVAAQLEEL